MKNITTFITLIHTLENLKKTKRTGWIRAGVVNPESVADHSFRMAFLALILGKDMGVDTQKAVCMALVHDIA